MFRFFEDLIDPFADYSEIDHPPQRLWPFLQAYCQPFKWVFLLAFTASVLVAGSEIGLIYALGWLVDQLQGDRAETLQRLGPVLIALAVFILLIRPILAFLDTALVNNTILTNMATLVRWRGHRHVMRQSVGWFEGDFAGRIANRVMQTPPAAGEVAFHVFDAMSYALAYVIGAF